MVMTFKEYFNRGILSVYNGHGIFVNPSPAELQQSLKETGISTFIVTMRKDVILFNGHDSWDKVKVHLLSQHKYDPAVEEMGWGSVMMNDDNDGDVDIDAYLHNSAFRSMSQVINMFAGFHVHYK
jgi:hypothetical protein